MLKFFRVFFNDMVGWLIILVLSVFRIFLRLDVSVLILWC